LAGQAASVTSARRMSACLLAPSQAWVDMPCRTAAAASQGAL